MADLYDVEIKVISQKGSCEAGHKVGDKFTVGLHTPDGLCTWAFCALFPFLSSFQTGGIFPWEKDENVTTVACPDPLNPVVFELKRIKK